MSPAPRNPGAGVSGCPWAAGGGYARGTMMIDTQVSCAFSPIGFVSPEHFRGTPELRCAASGGGRARSPLAPRLEGVDGGPRVSATGD